MKSSKELHKEIRYVIDQLRKDPPGGEIAISLYLTSQEASELCKALLYWSNVICVEGREVYRLPEQREQHKTEIKASIGQLYDRLASIV